MTDQSVIMIGLFHLSVNTQICTCSRRNYHYPRRTFTAAERILMEMKRGAAQSLEAYGSL